MTPEAVRRGISGSATQVREVRGALVAALPVEKPTRPKCGCPAESLQGVPVLAGNRLQRLTELENRISKASAGGRRRSRGLRDHQHFNRLAGLKWKAIQNEFAMLADCSLSPVCLHALSIEDGAFRMFSRSFERNRRFTGGIPPDQRRYGIMSLDHG